MRFENVAILVEQLHEQIRDQRYFWRDHHGPVCEQRGVFRVNCVDCLDRTNLVQSALAKAVLHTQLTRLAMLAPDVALPHTFRRAFQALWANNGDTISRQYAGTSALKGDYTRTGERRLAGVVRDSYNSASRYYLNRFRDAYRQAAIDTLLGRPIAEPDLQSPDAEDAGSGGLLSDQDGAEAYKREMDRQRQMIDHCRKMCINESEPLLGAWALWNAQHGSPSVTQDCVLLLSKDCYYLIDYDDLRERIIRCQCVLFEDLERIEFGPQGWSNVGAVNHGHHHHRHHHRHHHQNHHNHHLEKSIVIGSDDSNRSSSPNRSPKSTHRPQPATTYCLRIHYLFGLQSGYFHLLQANPAFLLGTASNEDPAEEQLRAIVQAFKLALSVRSLNVPLFEGKLERRRSKRPEVMLGDTYGESARVRLGAGVLRQARQAGERNLRGLRTAGQQAMHQVSHRFARFRQKFTKSPTSNAGLTTTTVADDTPVTVDTTLVITPDTEHSAIDVEDNEYDAIEEDDLLDIEDEEVDDEIDVDDEEELPDDDEDDYDDDDVLHESNRRRRRQLRQLLHSSSSTLDTSLASKCRSNTTLERTADLIQSPVERQSSSECSDQYDYDNRLTIGHDAMADGASSTFDCFEEPQSMPVQVVVQSKQAHHTLLESCGILTGQSWSIGPDQAQHSANTNRASSAVHVDTLIQDSKTDSDVTNASASVRPLIEVTPVDNAARSLSGNRPLSRSTVQLTDRSRTGADHRHRDGDTVARVVHISGGSTGSDTTGPVTSLPVHGGNDLTQTSSSCASSIACIAGAVGASRNSDSIGNALDRIRGNQSLLDATCQPIVQLKEYTRSNLDISHGIIGDKDHGTSIMMTGGGAEVSRLFANGHSINRTAPRMKNSQSECCIQEQPNESSVSKRDLIFNPLSRIARGVQHLNLNRLNPQQLMRRHHSNHQLEDAEYEWLQQRKRESRSKIIEF